MANYVPASIPYDEDNPVEDLDEIVYDISFPTSMREQPLVITLEEVGEDEPSGVDNLPKVLPPTPIPTPVPSPAPSPAPEDDHPELDEGGDDGTPPFSQLNRSLSPQGSTNLNPANFGNSPPVSSPFDFSFSSNFSDLKLFLSSPENRRPRTRRRRARARPKPPSPSPLRTNPRRLRKFPRRVSQVTAPPRLQVK